MGDEPPGAVVAPIVCMCSCVSQAVADALQGGGRRRHTAHELPKPVTWLSTLTDLRACKASVPLDRFWDMATRRPCGTRLQACRLPQTIQRHQSRQMDSVGRVGVRHVCVLLPGKALRQACFAAVQISEEPCLVEQQRKLIEELMKQAGKP